MSRGLQICFIVWRFPLFSESDIVGGAERQLQKLSFELGSKNHKVTIISSRRSKEPFYQRPHKNIGIVRVPTTALPILSMILFMMILPLILIRLHFRDKFDVIHIPLPDLFIIPIHLVSRLLRIPIITRVAADELDQSYSHGLWSIIRNLIKAIILKADGIQTLNPKAYADALRFGKPDDQVFLVPNGVRVPEQERDYAEIYNRIIYVGAMRYYPNKLRLEQKNLLYLIDAFKEMLKDLPDMTLVMVGDGNYRKKLEEYVREAGLQTKVAFTGFQLDIWSYLLEADILVNPSHFEGMPNVVVEAMAAGVYVICSDIPEHRYLVGNNEFGQLVNTSDSRNLAREVIRFYRDPTPYTVTAKRGRNKIKLHFSLSLMTERTLQMYKKVIRECYHIT